MIQLFDYVKLVFSRNEKTWSEVSDLDKSRNFFMLSRFMSIQEPIRAFYLNHYRIDAVAASDYWHRIMSTKYTKTPNWIYAKTIKRKDVEKKIDLPSDEMIRWWCERNEISRSEFDQNVAFFKDSFLSEVKALEKILKSQNILST